MSSTGITLRKNKFDHGHKNRKNSLEIRAVLSIFLLELEIFDVSVQGIHQNSKR